MAPMKHRIAIAAGVAAALALTSSAQAAVTVRVEGTSASHFAAVAPTGPAVVKDGNSAHSCTGDSAAGALERAVAGAWNGQWFSSGGYAVETIKGESYPFSQDGFYWALAVDNLSSSTGACDTKPGDGREVLFYKACAAATSGCYDGNILDARPEATRVAPGGTVRVSVKTATSRFSSGAFVMETAPASGVQLVAGGPPATSAADGSATVTVTGQRGPVALRATRGSNVPDQVELCVSDGADGFCGTTTPPTVCCAPPPDRSAGDGDLTSVRSGQVFARGRGPRELRGVVNGETQVAKVELRLTGRDGRRCMRFDAPRERIVTTRRCGVSGGRFFVAGTGASWRYLLPQRIGRGRWVVDVRVTDRAGNVSSTLRRGTSRTVFSVR